MRVLLFISVFAILLCIGALMWVLAKFKRDEEAKREAKGKGPVIDI
ncbi:MAG TPA: hypothetical protein VFT72_14925 [Opitutaceae bacterium]|nr:hypothetical protein [Opitutaceae bacterium]